MENRNDFNESPPSLDANEKDTRDGTEAELVNSSGHVQEMDRSFGLFSICAMGLMTDNAWGAGGGSLVISWVLHTPLAIYSSILTPLDSTMEAGLASYMASSPPSSSTLLLQLLWPNLHLRCLLLQMCTTGQR